MSGDDTKRGTPKEVEDDLEINIFKFRDVFRLENTAFRISELSPCVTPWYKAIWFEKNVREFFSVEARKALLKNALTTSSSEQVSTVDLAIFTKLVSSDLRPLQL